mmetsp:Transcript_14802/g.36156  ORF Transcript_14802/g.36156 Transcript_14802/m.36156 type:complete len:303 (-) Transcript_14802:991-1899(-)
MPVPLSPIMTLIATPGPGDGFLLGIKSLAFGLRRGFRITIIILFPDTGAVVRGGVAEAVESGVFGAMAAVAEVDVLLVRCCCCSCCCSCSSRFCCVVADAAFFSFFRFGFFLPPAVLWGSGSLLGFIGFNAFGLALPLFLFVVAESNLQLERGALLTFAALRPRSKNCGLRLDAGRSFKDFGLFVEESTGTTKSLGLLMSQRSSSLSLSTRGFCTGLELTLFFLLLLRLPCFLQLAKSSPLHSSPPTVSDVVWRGFNPSSELSTARIGFEVEAASLSPFRCWRLNASRYDILCGAGLTTGVG